MDQVFRLIYGFGLDHCWNWIFQFGRQFCGSGMDNGQWTTDDHLEAVLDAIPEQSLGSHGLFRIYAESWDAPNDY